MSDYTRKELTKPDKVFLEDLKQKYEEVKDSLVMDPVGMVAPLPVAVLDVAKLEVNCQRMIDATKRLGLLWRPHVKTHKTIQLTRLQVGDEDVTPVNIVVSTLAEIRMLLPLMDEYKARGREINILYSFPLHESALPTLGALHAGLPKDALTVMVDHPNQVKYLREYVEFGNRRLQVFIKIDTGYHRAGVLPGSPDCEALITDLLEMERSGHCHLHGLYSHASQSYNGRGRPDAIAMLAQEFDGLYRVAAARLSGRPKPLVLSVGATPTATAVQNPGLDRATAQDDKETTMLRELMASMKREGFLLEVHAGVYPTLDLQQLATHARDQSLMTHEDIALTILAEVVSLYPGRGPNNTTEALITAGSLALGREPVQSGQEYGGWGIVTPWISQHELTLAASSGKWLQANPAPGPEFPRGYKGWEVGRISQEHGILVWKGRKEDEVPLRIGQKVRIWPNHACIAGAGFDYYAVIDSRRPGELAEEVIDIWPRTRGW